MTSGLALALIVMVVGLGCNMSFESESRPSEAGKLGYFAGLLMFLIRISKLPRETLAPAFSAASIAFIVLVFGLVAYLATSSPRRAEVGRLTFLAALLAFLALMGDRVISFGL